MKYHAFISYSHGDRAWGEWLHRGIETFRIPRELVGRERQRSGGVVPERLFPVFRDREELPTSADLGSMLRDALDSSRYLIVICSPRAARSRWVNEEVLHFKRSGRNDRVLCVIVDGEPNAEDATLECFPPALRHPLTQDGVPDPSRFEEPIAADARSQGDGKRMALMKVVAGLAEVGFDELRQRELERSRRAMRRWLMAATALVLVFAGLAAFAVAQRNRALTEERRTKQTLSRSDFLQADELMTRGEPHAALLHLSRAAASDPDDIAVRQRLTALLKQRSWPYEVLNPVPTGESGLRAVSPLPGGEAFLVQSFAGYQQVWSRNGSAVSPPLMHDDVEWIGPVSFNYVMHPNGGRMASGGHDGKVRLWLMPGGESAAPPIDLGSKVTAILTAPGGERLAAGSAKGRVFMMGWDGQRQEWPDFSPQDDLSVTALALSGDSGSIAAAWDEGLVRARRLDGVADFLELTHPGRVNAMIFSADGRELITGCQDGGLRIWELETGRLKQKLMLTGAVGCIRNAPDGSSLLVGHGDSGNDWEATLYSLTEDRDYVLKLAVSHPNRDLGNRVAGNGLGDCSFSPDGRRFLTWTGMDREVRCWSSVDGRMEIEPFLHPSPVGGAGFRGNEEVVTTASDGRIRIWNWSTAFEPETMKLRDGYWIGGLWSPDRTRWLGLARGNGEGNQGILAILQRLSGRWNLTEVILPKVGLIAGVTNQGDKAFVGLLGGGALKVNLTGGDFVPLPGLEEVEVEQIGVVDSSHLLVGTNQGKLIRLNFVTEKVEEAFEAGGAIRFLRMDPTGRRALVGMDSSILWWVDPSALSKSKQLPGHSLAMATAAFTQDGRCFASADLEGWVQVWNVGDSPALAFKARQDAEVTALAFSPDGSVLASGGRDDRVNCWAVKEAGALLCSTKARSWVSELTFHKDGRRLLVSDIKGQIGAIDSLTGFWVVDPLAMAGESAACGWWGEGIFGINREGLMHFWEFTPSEWEGLAALGELVSRCEFTQRGALQRISSGRGFRNESDHRGTPTAMINWWLKP